MDLPKVNEYKTAFNIEGPLQELVHLICAKPFLHSLAFQDIDLKWHEDSINFEAELDRSGDTFLNYIFKGYTSLFRMEDYNTNTGYFHHESLRTKSYKKYSERAVAQIKSARGTLNDPVKIFFRELFTNDIVLPYGMLDGFTVHKAYPTIAAINTYCGFFGNPVLRQAYQISASDSPEHEKHGDIKEWLISLIGENPSLRNDYQDYNSLTGGEMKGLNSISPAEFAQTGAQLVILDEPKLYSDKGDEIFQEYLEVICSLDQVYNQGRDSGLIELLKEARGAIMELRNIENYFEAKLKWQSLAVSTPDFPIYAWDFDNHRKAIRTITDESERYFQQFRERLSESPSEIIEKKLICEDLWKELEDSDYKNYDSLVLSKDDLKQICLNQGTANGYERAKVFEYILQKSCFSRVLEHFLRDDAPSTVKVHSKNKKLRDLALLTHILTITGFFKRVDDAARFVAHSFIVSDQQGLSKTHTEGTIKQERIKILNSKKKIGWN